LINNLIDLILTLHVSTNCNKNHQNKMKDEFII